MPGEICQVIDMESFL